MDRLKLLYARVRRIPRLGGLISRLVWGVKGLLGRPVNLLVDQYGAPVIQTQLHARTGFESRESPKFEAILWETIVNSLLDRPAVPKAAVKPLPPRRALAPQALRFTIVINTLNRADSLARTLSSLPYLRYSNFEVVVVVGPCTDHTWEVLEGWRDRIRIGTCPEANLSQSRNIGIAMARGDVICFIDDDAVPEPNWLDGLAKGYLLGADAVGGYIRDHSGVQYQAKVIVVDRLARSEPFESLSAAQLNESPGADRFLSLTGTNSSFRRDALLAIGGFDMAYAYFLDETDVNARLVDAGGRQTVVEGAEIHHKYAASHLRDQHKIPKSVYLPARSTAYFCARNAESGKEMPSVVAHLVAYADQLERDHTWLLKEGLISSHRRDSLIDDARRGIVDGLTLALREPERRLLTTDILSAYASSGWHKFSLSRNPSQRLRICLISQEYPPTGIGGIGQWTQGLAESMAALGHEVTVVTRAAFSAATVDFEQGVWVHRIIQRSERSGDHPDLSDIPPSLAEWCHSVREEVLRVHAVRGLDVVSGPIWDLEPLALLRAGDLPLVVSLHTTYALALPHKPDWLGNPRYKKQHVDKVIAAERVTLGSAHALLANSTAIIKELEQTYNLNQLAAQCHIVPHAARFLPSEVPDRLVRKTKETHVLFVGRLEARKGADTAVEAAMLACDRDPELVVTFAGDDTIRFHTSTLRKAAERRRPDLLQSGRIVFTGVVDNQTLSELYARSDIMLAPSRFESFGLIFVEAMAFGLPVIAGDIAAAREVLQPGQDSILVSPDDPQALCEAILTLASDSSLRYRMGVHARGRALAEYSSASMVDRCLEVYQLVAQNRPPS